MFSTTTLFLVRWGRERSEKIKNSIQFFPKSAKKPLKRVINSAFRLNQTIFELTFSVEALSEKIRSLTLIYPAFPPKNLPHLKTFV